MKRTLTTVALATSFLLGSLPAARAAGSSHRHQLVSQPTHRVEVKVTGGSTTWFTGSDAQGETLAIVFLPRFATVLRDGERVPVSYLKPGDTVQVEGQISGRRMAASSAQITTPSVTTARASKAP
jgi:hypothetical protein